MRRFLAALGLLILSPTAFAAPEACPADAEQRLYDMIQSIQRGEQSEAGPVAELAEWAITTCADRSHTQALAATLIGVVIPATAEHDQVARYLDLAETALRQNDYAWTPKLGSAKLKNADGTITDYFGYANASTALTGTFLPYAAGLAEAGTVPRMLSGEAYAVCPYADHAANRLEQEADLWDAGVKQKSDQPIYALAETRLKMLHASCPNHRRDLDFYLARLFGQEVTVLTNWTYSYQEATSYRTAAWYWRNPSLGLSIFDDDEAAAKKAELAAQARPLAVKAKAYLDGLYVLPAEISYRDRGQLDQASVWKKSVEALLAPQ
jgi:hypothetical protein